MEYQNTINAIQVLTTLYSNILYNTSDGVKGLTDLESNIRLKLEELVHKL